MLVGYRSERKKKNEMVWDEMKNSEKVELGAGLNRVGRRYGRLFGEIYRSANKKEERQCKIRGISITPLPYAEHPMRASQATVELKEDEECIR